MPTRRTLAAFLLSAAIWSCLAVALQRCQFAEGLRLFWLDQLFVARHELGKSPAPHEDVIIVGIDEHTTRQMRQIEPAGSEQRVILRRTITRVLKRLAQAGAKAVAVDYLLDIPLGEPHDAELLDVLSGPGQPPIDVVLGSFQTVRGTKRPFDELRGWADEGNVILQGDRDGKFRRVRPELVVTAPGEEGQGEVLIPLFAFQAARLQAGSRDNEFASARATPWTWNQQTDGSLSIPGLPPVPPEMLVDFVGPAQTFEMLGRQFSAADVLDGKVGDEKLAGKLVFVGPTVRNNDRFAVSIGAAGSQQAYRRFLQDKYARELRDAAIPEGVDLLSSGAMSGVEIHANAASQILQGRYLSIFDRRLPTLSLVLPLLLVGGAGWAFWRPSLAGGRRLALRAVITAAVMLLAAAGLVAASLAAFIFAGWVFIPLGLVVAWVGHAACGLSWQGVRHRRYSQRIERMYGSAVGQELLDYLNAHPEAMNANIRRDATLLFCDIRGFTPLTERMDSDEVVSLLREHFETLCKPLTDHGAWVDKYVGDLVMAAWNVLQPSGDHALRAVRAAMEMQGALRQANLQRQQRHLPAVEVGIGIHTGEVVAGNVGSLRRSNFTIIGDTVNLASRIESTARPGQILVSQQTFDALAGQVPCDQLPAATIKGKSGQYVLYAVRQEGEPPGE